MSKQITIKIVAQSGYVWEEELSQEKMKERVREIVNEHDDIERIEILDSEGFNPEIVWRMK